MKYPFGRIGEVVASVDDNLRSSYPKFDYQFLYTTNLLRYYSYCFLAFSLHQSFQISIILQLR